MGDEMTGITENELERVRVLNALQMFENGGMGDAVGTDGRMRLLPLMCKTVIEIRKLNKKLLEQLKERSWKPFTETPVVGDRLLVLLLDGEVVTITVRETDDFTEYAHLWMKVPSVD